MCPNSPLSLDAMKRAAARAALEFAAPGTVLGVGSGTTVWSFVELLGESGIRPGAAVAASQETARRLRAIGVPVVELAKTSPAVYVDGADQVDRAGRAIKGGGAAHTREKAIAMASTRWVCVVDESKLVDALGGVPVPLEVRADALEAVRSAVSALGGSATVRDSALTDAGNPVLDVIGLPLEDALGTEVALDAIPGVVGNGIFARRTADVILVGRSDGTVERIEP